MKLSNDSLTVLIDVLSSDSTDDVWLKRTAISLAEELIRVRTELYSKP